MCWIIFLVSVILPVLALFSTENTSGIPLLRKSTTLLKTICLTAGVWLSPKLQICCYCCIFWVKQRSFLSVICGDNFFRVFSIGVDWGDKKRLVIKKIKAGLVARWNKEHPTQPVSVGDHIVEINGCRGDAKKLVDAVNESSTNTMTLPTKAY